MTNELIEVIQTASFFHSQNNLSEGGLVSQLTKCKYKGIVFYVRESLNGTNSFYISSSERQGDKAGSKPSIRRQALELLAPDYVWEEIMNEVKKADNLHRPVLKNKHFNMSFVNKILK